MSKNSSLIVTCLGSGQWSEPPVCVKSAVTQATTSPDTTIIPTSNLSDATRTVTDGKTNEVDTMSYRTTEAFTDGATSEISTGAMASEGTTIDVVTRKDQNNPCKLEDRYFHENDACYEFVSDKKSWQSASDRCSSYGGSLASPDNPNTYEFLLGRIKAEDSYWIISSTPSGQGNHRFFSSRSQLLTFIIQHA